MSLLDLSIIIPVYNTPTQALQRCFESIAPQDPILWEALIIDDGSKDETAEFCKNYAQQHSAFRYFRKENGGVSSARNLGLDHAQGKYITFLDADDILLPVILNAEPLETDPDLVFFDTALVENENKAIWHAFDTEDGPLSKEVLLRQLIASKSLNGPCAKLFKQAIIADNNIRFNTDFVTAEDWDFVCRFILKTEMAIYCKVPAYVYYRDGGNSKSRIGRFPDVVIQNLIAMFRRKQEIISTLLADHPEATTLLSTAATFLIEDLFNSAADLLILRKLTKDRKNTIQTTCRSVAAYLLPTAPKKTRIKVWITCHFWIGVYPLACLRELYLKLH